MVCKKKNKNGSALAMVLVFMVIMSILGTGVLALAQHSAVRSRAAAQADRGFYAAESAAQLAAQVFFDEELILVIEDTITADFGVSVSAKMEEMKNTLYLALLSRLGEIESNINTLLEGMLFNGEEASVTIAAPDLDGCITGDYETFVTAIGQIELESGESFTEYEVTYNLKAYADEPTFQICATSGGRTVTAQPGYTVTLGGVDTVVVPPVVDGSGTLVMGTAAYAVKEGDEYVDKTGGIYGDGESGSGLYENYVTALNVLIENAAASYENHRAVSSIINTSAPGFPGATNYGGTIPTDAKYINSSGGITLVGSSSGAPREFPELEYIYISTHNRLTVEGNVSLPKLKGIYANGITFSGGATFSAPVLENVYSGDSSIEIKSGVKINPMDVDGAGNIINDNKPVNGGANFFQGSGIMTITGSTEINWCRFNVGHLKIDYGTEGKLTSNSIFISRNWLDTSGTISADTSRVVPQFYMKGYINLSYNLGNISGIYMTPDTRYVCNNGNGVAEGTKFTGLFVGNYNKHFSNIGGVNYYEHPIDATIEEFGAREMSILMDGGYVAKYLTGGGGGPSAPGSVTVEREITISYSGLHLRETTGE